MNQLTITTLTECSENCREQAEALAIFFLSLRARAGGWGVGGEGTSLLSTASKAQVPLPWQILFATVTKATEK